MKTHNHLYSKIISIRNLILAWKKARKSKTKKKYVIEFESNLRENLMQLHYELKSQTYSPRKLITFILRDPKTRKISKSDFRDRIVHHAIINIIEPIFDKSFIFDSCANRNGKGNLFAINRLHRFIKKVSENGNIVSNRFNDANYVFGYCLKADIKHYFEEVNHQILLNIIKRKIKDERTIRLIKIIINANSKLQRERERAILKGMPLGNLTSQFFANLYLNELDHFIKHELKAKYYIRYVDDFIILHNSKEKLLQWKNKINDFLTNTLKLELHPNKTKITPISRGIDFVGFRNFFYFKLPRKRNITKMINKIDQYKEDKITKTKLLESFQGWQAYAKWANTYKLRKNMIRKIYKN